MSAEVGRNDVGVNAVARGETAKPHVREFLNHGQRHVGAGAGAAVLLSHVGTQQSGTAQGVPQGSWDNVILLPLLVVGRNLLLESPSGHIAEQLHFIKIDSLVHGGMLVGKRAGIMPKSGSV